MAAMAAVPHGAAVIMSFGEIDCREGLLVSVERGRYPDLEASFSHSLVASDHFSSIFKTIGGARQVERELRNATF